VFNPKEHCEMTALSKPNGFFRFPTGTALLGEIITWSCSGVAVRHLDLIDALTATELDPAVARELAPRHAFTRACKKLSDDRIIRQVAEDDTTLTFQFTAESRVGDRYEYTLETRLHLNKSSGRVTCDLPGLATLAQESLDNCIQSRTGSDITRLIQRLFEKKADLFPIREQGGCYFVPLEHAGFVDKIQAFLGRINGRVGRFPIPTGTVNGDRSVKETVAAGIASLIAEHRASVAAFGTDTREGTLKRAAERIKEVRFKVAAYAAYLAEERDRLERDLTITANELRSKIESLAPVSA
jgi:hypothetical protein